MGIPTRPPRIRSLNWGSLVRKAWGDSWLKREVVYRMANGREFRDSGAAGGIYAVPALDALLLEQQNEQQIMPRDNLVQQNNSRILLNG